MTLLHDTLDRLQASLLAVDNHDPLKLLSWAASAGVSPAGLGSHRLCVALSTGHVAKLAYKTIGCRDNEVEWTVWQHAAEQQRSWLCPAIALTGASVLIMQRCLPVTLSQTSVTYREAVRSLAQIGIGDSAVNLGAIDGRLVCYDYAQVSAQLMGRITRQHRAG